MAAGHRALVFSQWTSLLDLTEPHLKAAGMRFARLDGATRDRASVVRSFQEEREVPLMLVSLKAGGTGLNLTMANRVFHFDRWWNPAVEDQATDRAFRIGQQRNVFVHKFVCTGTLEERIDQMIERKTELARNIIGAGEDWLTELSTVQLRELLQLRQSAMEGEA